MSRDPQPIGDIIDALDIFAAADRFPRIAVPGDAVRPSDEVEQAPALRELLAAQPPKIF